MREDVENVFTVLPFGEDIKHNIYTQMCKHLFTMPPALKQDLRTYLMLDRVICAYYTALATDYIDQNYFLYSLYNDLLFNVHAHKLGASECFGSHPLGDHDHEEDDEMVRVCKLLKRRATRHYPVIIDQIKYFWRMSSPERRLRFVRFMETKFESMDTKRETPFTDYSRMSSV